MLSLFFLTITDVCIVLFIFLVVFSLIYLIYCRRSSISRAAASDFVVLGLIPSIISSVLTTVVLYLVGHFGYKTEISGNYRIEIRELDGNWIPFGTARVKASLFEQKIRYEGLDLKGNPILKGDGAIIGFKTIAGYYQSYGRELESRFGSFLYEIDKSGEVFEGKFIFIDKASDQIQSGNGRWVRVR